MIYELQKMTTESVDRKIAEGIDTVMLPVGSTEQHGPGCPVGTDTFALELIGKRTAEKLGCFWAPTLVYGMSTHHRKFKGTIGLSSSTLALVVKELLMGLAAQGFQTLIVMNGHGGNIPALGVATREAKDVYPDRLIAVCNCLYGLTKSPKLSSMLADYGDCDLREFTGHGGVVEIALDLAYDASLVKLDKAVAGDAAKVIANEGSSVQVVADIQEYTTIGTFGASRGASVELGETIAEIASDQIKNDILKAKEIFGKTS